MMDSSRRRAVASLSILSCVLLLLAVSNAEAQVVRQLTDGKSSEVALGQMDDLGSFVYAISSGDPAGTNPEYAYQIFRWDPATGIAQQVTDLDGGVLYPNDYIGPSVSDDGQWLAFVSPGDPTGNNHDQSPELFVMKADGSEILQLTNQPGPAGYGVSWPIISGSGNRVVFLSSSDYLGTNPDHIEQLYVIDADGTGLVQLTGLSEQGVWWPSISDDGSRITFEGYGEVISGSPLYCEAIYAVNADGSNLRRLTDMDACNSLYPEISGSGSLIVFASDGDPLGTNSQLNEEVFAINWDGTGLRQLTDTFIGAATPGNATLPTVTDDAQVVFYAGQDYGIADPSPNAEVWRINSDGTGWQQVSDTDDGPPVPQCWASRGSGSGNRVTFWCDGGEPYGGNNPDLGRELYVIDSDGSDGRQLTETRVTSSGEPDITPDGSRIVFVSTADLLGTDPDGKGEVYRIEHDGSGLTQITDLTDGTAYRPSISGDGSTIVFASDGNPTGGNPDLGWEVFLTQSDGTGLVQLTSYSSALYYVPQPRISPDGRVIVFGSAADLTGSNPSQREQIFRVDPDGSNLAQLTSDGGGQPRVDAGGVWVVFDSNGDPLGTNPGKFHEVFRIRTDGTGLQQITFDDGLDYFGKFPDVSGAGDRIVYHSKSDPLGTNPERNSEIFLYETGTGTTRQLTSTTTGESEYPSISRDGAFVYFTSYASILDDHGGWSPFRVTVATGDVHRVGALRRCYPVGFYRGDGSPAPDVITDQDGDRAVFMAYSECTEQNPDFYPEVFLIDRTTPANIHVSKASPTVVSWDVESGPLRYDVIRGDVADLAFGSPDTVDLGEVVCLENDSPDADTIGFEDPDDPLPGQAFFYLYRGTQGAYDGPGSYGRAKNGAERTPGTGGCDP